MRPLSAGGASQFVAGGVFAVARRFPALVFALEPFAWRLVIATCVVVMVAVHSAFVLWVTDRTSHQTSPPQPAHHSSNPVNTSFQWPSPPFGTTLRLPGYWPRYPLDSSALARPHRSSAAHHGRTHPARRQARRLALRSVQARPSWYGGSLLLGCCGNANVLAQVNQQ